MADTLQSLMALRAAKQLYPNLEIHFVARESFAAAAERVSWIENVITFPTTDILGPVLANEKTDLQALGDIARWIAPMVKEPWDLIVNWSYSEASSYLTGILPARVKLGYSRRKDTTFCSVDGWSHYIQAIVQGEIHQNIHITDILTTQLLTALQIHFGEPANEGDAPVTSKSFFTLETTENDLGWCWRDHSRKWIGIQLGTTNKKVVWSMDNWASLMHQILKNNPGYSFVLLGDRADQPRAQELLVKLEALTGENPLSSKHVLSLVGETDFDLWASVISGCQWLFACDTASVHLASVLGTRVLNISPGATRWAEVGPYGNGHYVVSAATAGTTDVAPEAVYSAWSYGALEWSHRRQISLKDHAEQNRMSSSLSSVRVLRSKIRGTQDGGGVHYEPLISDGLTENEWMGMVIGHVARAWYCGWVPPIGQELQREKFSPMLIQKLREIDESAGVLSRIYTEAAMIALSLNKKSSQLKSDKVMRLDDRAELRDLGKQLIELESLVDRLTVAQPCLKAFLQMSKVLMHNLRGDGIADLGKETASCYRQLNEGVSVLKEWLKYSLKLTKPVAVPAQFKPRSLPETIP
jgi:ADP-heptose:LPS heptosyltransferase